MGLGAGEVMQRRAVARLRHDAEIDLKAGTQHDGRTRRALGDDVFHLVIGDERLHHVDAGLTGHQNVEIADRLLAPPVAAGDDYLFDALDLFEIGDEGRRELLGLPKADARRGLPAMLDFLQDVGLGLGAEAGQCLKLSRLGGLGEILDMLDGELVIENLDPLGAEAGQGGELNEVARHGSF